MPEPTVQTIQECLFGIGVDSANRLEVMLRLLAFQPSQVFWPVFLDTWPSCDATWWLRRDLLILLRQHHAKDPGPTYLQGDDRAFFDGLPDMMEVFRGCSQPRVRGLAWTTSHDTAAGFARGHRGIAVPQPVIARALIPKGAVFSVCTERNEDEVILDPRRIRNLQLTG